MSAVKRVESIHPAPEGHWVGDGFPVRSLFSIGEFNQRLSPFLMLDYAGPAQFGPSTKPRGVSGHPHKGFETVTIVYQGEVEHRDSVANHGTIGPGDVQWMTAGSGILHEEMHSRPFTERGGTLEMAQLWVNLPARFKSAPPSYQTILNGEVPSVDLDGVGRVRVIAGEFGDVKGPARTFTPINVWDVRLNGGRAELPVPADRNTAVVVFGGDITINGDQMARAGEVVVFEGDGELIGLESTGQAKLLMLDGEPLNEPIAAYGPFVMNTADEIHDAIAQFRNGAMGELQ